MPTRTRWRAATVATAALVVSAAPACSLDLDALKGARTQADAGGAAPRHTFTLAFGRDVDILFVIDNSNTMQSEQDLLARQLPRFLDNLHGAPGGFPNLHLGVISTDLGAGNYSLLTCWNPGGDRGELQGQARGACEPPTPEPYIVVDNSNQTFEANVPDTAVTVRPEQDAPPTCEPGPGGVGDGVVDACDVSEAFSCIGRLGVGGCGFEQPFEAMVRALCRDDRDFDFDGDGEPEWLRPTGYCQSGKMGANRGFLRDESLLTVVFVGDEDDCSAQRGELFTPATDRLGPLQSFRCFEFGARCGDRCGYGGCPDGAIARVGGQQLRDCRPALPKDGSAGEQYLFSIERYTSFLRTLRPSEGRLLVAAITGPWRNDGTVIIEQDRNGNPDVAPSCFGPGDQDQAAPGLRFRTLIAGLGDAGLFGEDVGTTICSDDFSPILDDLADRIIARLASGGCVPVPLVGRAGRVIESGEEAECTVQHVRRYAADEDLRIVLPRCEFADRQSQECPGAGKTPGRVGNFDGACWYLCDSRGQAKDCGVQAAAGPGSPFRWQLRLCGDQDCASTLPGVSVLEVACRT